jgi:hypothetical protein
MEPKDGGVESWVDDRGYDAAFEQRRSYPGSVVMVTRRSLAQHPIKRLVDHGTITREQGAACDEMHDVFLAVARIGNIQNGDLLRNVRTRSIGAERVSLAKHKRLFDAVLAEMGKDGPMIFDMIEGALTFTEVARKYGVRLVTAKAKLFKALDLWINMKAGTCF